MKNELISTLFRVTFMVTKNNYRVEYSIFTESTARQGQQSRHR